MEYSGMLAEIAQSLARDYEDIFYIDIETGKYTEFSPSEMYESMHVPTKGEDFYSETRENARRFAHPDDREFAVGLYYKEAMLKNLKDKKSFSYKYRIMVSGEPRYFRFTVIRTNDEKHFVLCVKDIHDEITAENLHKKHEKKKEQDHLRALNTERELARRDELTGTKNKTAYAELERSVQTNIDNGVNYLPFAIAVCDINWLKQINDTEGHKSGDEYIKAAAKLLCDTFVHSPVFRIGGDEFAIFLRGDDYSNREKLINRLKSKVQKNLAEKRGPVVAVGYSDFNSDTDRRITDVFERADEMMYENKRQIKENY